MKKFDSTLVEVLSVNEMSSVKGGIGGLVAPIIIEEGIRDNRGRSISELVKSLFKK